MSNPYRYTLFSDFLASHIQEKVQKISIHAGFTCPNRDGSIGYGGCTYCNNQTFSPEYCQQKKNVTQQLKEGIAFFSRKYPSMKYLAYFQAYTNTYGSLDHLTALYEEALQTKGVIGLVIGTRPDCISQALLSYLSELSKHYFILIEYGVESTNNQTLKHINRGHTWEQAKEAIWETAQYSIFQGAHLILGLPEENHDTIIQHAQLLSELPLQTLKLHQLQLIRQTFMAEEYKKNPNSFHLYTVDEYISLVIDFLEHLSPTIAVERFTSQSPEELLIAPRWGLKNHEFTHRLLREMENKSTWQGKFFQQKQN